MASQPGFRLVLGVEDPELHGNLVSSLTAAGFHIRGVAAARAAVDLACASACDAVILSLGPPESEGTRLCRDLRAALPEVGIVMIRPRSALEDELMALDAGADDCIAAPFRFRELVARLNSVLRRVRVERSSKSALLRAGELEMDVERRRFTRAQCEIHLSPREFDLLVYFMRNPAVTLTHLKLLRAVWGPGSGLDAAYLRSYIKSLRKKIEKDPGRPAYIVTEPWVGYRFDQPSDAV